MFDVSILSPKTAAPRIVVFLRSISHFSYIQSTLEALLHHGVSLQLVFDAEASAGHSTEFVKTWERQHGLSHFIYAKRHKMGWRRYLHVIRELASYGSFLRRREQSEFFLRRWRGYLPNRVRFYLQRRTVGKILNVLIGSLPFTWMARAIELLAPADPDAMLLLRQLQPDAIVATPANTRFSAEVEFLKAAKRLHIPSAVPVYSWDNLTTKGLFHCRPDLLLAWNETHAEEAVRIHGIPRHRVAITGAPFFDKWFTEPEQGPESRQHYCRKVGLDPARPFLTYLGSSSNVASDESWLVKELAETLLNHEDPAIRQYQVLVRPHPANFKGHLTPLPPNAAVWPRPPFDFEHGVPETSGALRDQSLALQLSVATIGINTSAMLESIIEDKPSFAFLSDLYRPTQQDTTHFQTLSRTGTLYPIHTRDELVRGLQRLAHGEDPARGARRAFVLNFMRPHGLAAPAATLQASAILALSRGVPAHIISSQFSPKRYESWKRPQPIFSGM